MESKIEEYLSKKNEDINAAKEYETLLQKLEASIRQHISYEHQFKIEYEKLLNKAEEIDLENKILSQYVEKQDSNIKKISNQNKEYKKRLEKIEKENEILKKEKNILKEKIDMKEKELIQYQIKLKELKEINKTNYLYNSNKNNFRTKSYLSKSNSSINIYKENIKDNKENYCSINLSKKPKNNIYRNKLIKIIKKNNQNITMNNLTLSLQNLLNKSNSKTKKKKKYNNSINYFNKKYINNISSIFYIRDQSKNKRKKIANTSLNKKSKKINSNSRNKSMLNLFPSRNVNYLFNNSNKHLNNTNNNNKKKKSSKSFNITQNTYNMNKNNVMINLNTNIINTNTPMEQFKVQKKLLEYKKYINKKLNEFSKKNNKRINNNLNTSSNKKKTKIKINPIHYKKINKIKYERKISPFMHNIKLNFSSNKSNHDSSNKNKIRSNTNIINTNNNTNSKPNLKVVLKGTKNKKIGLTTLKNFVFSKK